MRRIRRKKSPVAANKRPNAALRRDIRFLTTLLGDVIREQEGEALFLKIERMRKLAREIRQNTRPELIAKQQRLVKSLKIEEAYKIARAFTTYFQLVNIAEERHRVRRIRHYERDPSLFQDMSLRKLFKDLRDKKVSGQAIQKLLAGMEMELILTAHPTEAKRRTVLDHLLRIAIGLGMLEREDASMLERLKHVRRIKGTLEILWQTAEIRQRKVKVLDEVEQTLFYFQRTIVNLVPDFYDKVLSEFRRFYGPKKMNPSPFVRFGSWVGSDRDGNPGVTCEVTRQAVFRQRRLIFKLYRATVESLMLASSQSVRLMQVSRPLLESLRRDAQKMPRLAEELERFEKTEVYRKKFSFIYQKLENTFLEKRPYYASADEFVNELLLIRNSLTQNKGSVASVGDLDCLVSQAKTFGFHLAKMDFRDHSRKIRKAVSEILGEAHNDPDVLLRAILRPPKSLKRVALSSDARDIIDQLGTLKELRTQASGGADDYIISQTETHNDLLMLFYLAQSTDLIRVKSKMVTRADLGIVPLFESIDALQKCDRVMDQLFSIPLYRSYVRQRGDFQQVMLGYSDSSKDGGYLAANWKLYLAQKRLVEVAARHKIKLQIFHGKGGTIDRGGGESHKAILAQPFAAAGGQMKVTEQGEVIAQKYANAVIAERNLEQLISAVLWTNLVTKKEIQKSTKMAEWEERMTVLSDDSFEFYRNLIMNTEGFLEFYNQATPIRVLGHARIGSRPARRSNKSAFEDLRAIPWVFSWIQSRYIISAWYGMGFALERYFTLRGDAALKELQEMYQGWPFFRSVINNAQISLAKTDLYIAKQYGTLVKDRALGERIHGLIAAEYRRTVKKMLEISGQSALLDFHPVLKESIRARNPYVDPLNYLQLRFLNELRNEGSGSLKEARLERIHEILLLTVNGIAFGMKSTG